MLVEKQGLYDSFFEHDNCGAGFICSLRGKRTNDIIHKAFDILVKLEHRGAKSADGKTGDGAGLLIEIPHQFFKERCSFNLPDFQDYAVGMVFLPTKEYQRNYCIEILQQEIQRQGLRLLGWRKVPVNRKFLGEIASQTEPNIQQVFIGKSQKELTQHQFNIKLYIARKIAENKISKSKLSQKNYFYLPSLSPRTIIYKGLLRAQDISNYYTELSNEQLVTRFSLVHQRFSTNTFPSWELAHPFRYMCHNGEINTFRGNYLRMFYRQEKMADGLFGDQMDDIFPIIPPGKSDSASMDMAIELLLATGRTLPEVMMMLVPEAWEKHNDMPNYKKAFYHYNSCIMEPWDGPASIPFTDGNYIGAILDRNGLRPSRYTVTKDGYVVMSSETGVLEIAPENVAFHGRLEPGKMFLVNMDQGRIVDDHEIKKEVCTQRNYTQWLDENLLPLKKVPYLADLQIEEKEPFATRLRIFGYTHEDIKTIITPMAVDGKEAIGSMGSDTPLAVLSNRPQLLYNYFKQLFAQVTNPPLDGIREEIVTDISLSIGNNYNLFDIDAKHAKKLHIKNPIISNKDLFKIKHINHPDFKAVTIPALYNLTHGLNGLEHGLSEMLIQIEKAIDQGANIIVISDRSVDEQMAPIPMLLACSHIHHSFQRLKRRSDFGIILETAEPREPHHFSCLFGYGASAINPYLVNEIIIHKIQEGAIELSVPEAINNFNTAIGKGIVKIMNKIGISTLHSYRGAQIFEALGLSQSFVDTYFSQTPTRIEGVGLYEIEKEIYHKHHKAYTYEKKFGIPLEIGGEYRWRRDGEDHSVNPKTVAQLQIAVRRNQWDNYNNFSNLINQQNQRLMTLRGLMTFTSYDPIPIEQVESWTQIVKRFKTGAMSLGSLSREAHENLAIAMNRIGGKSNSGEGGEDPVRFTKDENGDWRNSAIKQVASGRFGVTSHYLSSAREIQIKMAQGAKPGEGGQLPGKKVDPYIASVRNSTPYVGLISPPPHHDIYSIEDLAQLIFDLKNANREARINVKLVSEVGVGTVAAGVAKAKADVILIAGYDGGTGASPLTSIKHAGLPWELGIAEVQQTLVMNDLRSRVVIECDGQLKTGRDVAVAALLGAEEFGFSTAPLIASGCIMMRACHLNTCPVGVATQDPELRKNFQGTPEHVVNYFHFVAEELRMIMAQLGFRTIEEMVGQSQKLNMRKAISHYKARGLDFSKILFKPQTPNHVNVYNTTSQDHELENVLDLKLLDVLNPAIKNNLPFELEHKIQNTDRAVGAILSHEISKQHGAKGLNENQIQITFNGSAGQSFGAFAAKGLYFKLVGNANDYFGKGLSGATLIAQVPSKATFVQSENIIIGNVALYGATNGYAFINGVAGERFCVRNSGAHAVVEGVGDHGCEYMTGGIAVILGKYGRNFAAGMSGGIAYIYDENRHFNTRNFNLEMVELEKLNSADYENLHELISNHVLYTNSHLGQRIIENWKDSKDRFIKVMPTDYKKALELMTQEIKTEETIPV
ncbi:MAG: glutamate synthase large subunit [Flavobacteriaceae bacterium]|nr:glutamate synthase large subunit [Flavobacteriaceae bacterium]